MTTVLQTQLTKQQKYCSYFLLVCIAIGFFNLPLRLSPESLSLYRLVIPFQILCLLGLSLNYFLYWLISSLCLTIFGCIGLLVSGYGLRLDYNLVFYLHYVTIVLIFFSAGALLRYHEPYRLDKFLKFFWAFFVALGFLELLTGFSLPNVEQQSGVIRGMMMNENDYSLVIASAAIYFLFYCPERLFSYSTVLLSLYISILNGSKLITLSLGLTILVYLIYKLILENKSKPLNRVIYGSIGFVFLTSSIIFLIYYSSKIQVGNMNLVELAFDPVRRIIFLEPYGIGYGSLTVRTDMTIYAIKDLINSYGLGIGFGNSLALIETGRYGVILEGAKSLHNFPLQVVLELGVISTSIFAFLILKYKSRKEIIVILLFFIISLSQSAGIFSNYYFLFVFGIVIFIKKYR